MPFITIEIEISELNGIRKKKRKIFHVQQYIRININFSKNVWKE